MSNDVVLDHRETMINMTADNHDAWESSFVSAELQGIVRQRLAGRLQRCGYKMTRSTGLTDKMNLVLSTPFSDLNNMPTIQIGQCFGAVVIAKNQLHVFFTKFHACVFGSTAAIPVHGSSLVMKGKMDTSFSHQPLEGFPFSLLAWLAAFVGIAFGALKHACGHVRALIGQATCGTNCSGRFAVSALAPFQQIFFLFLEGFKVFATGVEIAPEARGTQIPNFITVRIAPGDNMVNALGVFLKAISAILAIDHYHLYPSHTAVADTASCSHVWQTFIKETSPLAGCVGLPRSRISKNGDAINAS